MSLWIYLFGSSSAKLLEASRTGNYKRARSNLKYYDKSTDTNGNTPLHLAAIGGHGVIVKLLIDAYVDRFAINTAGDTCAHLAARLGNQDVLRLLRRPNDPQILKQAAWDGNLKTVEALLHSDADLAKSDTDSLYWAAHHGHLEVVRILLAHGADVNTRITLGWTPLETAAGYGHLEVVRILLAHGADVNTRDDSGRTPLMASIGHMDVAELLLAHGADVSAVNKDHETPLHRAASSGHVEVAELLLAHGADVKARDKGANTPLHWAAWGHVHMAKELLAHGADVSAVNNDHETPLHRAASSGHVDVAELLLAHRADVKARDKGANTPLHRAASSGHVDVAKVLLAHGADVIATDQYGNIPLSEACRNGKKEVAELLRRHGGRYLDLHSACRHGAWEDITGLLKENPNLVFDKDDRGRTPLHYAASSGRMEVAELLLAHGADVNARDKEGDTPQWLAYKQQERFEENIRRGQGGNLEDRERRFPSGETYSEADYQRDRNEAARFKTVKEFLKAAEKRRERGPS